MAGKKKVIEVPSSGVFEGADGPWSTFLINIGDGGDGRSGQDFRVLVSSASSTTLLPVKTDWCNHPSPLECAQRRGILPFRSRQSLGYLSNVSDKYQDLGVYNINIPKIQQKGEFNGRYGLDSVGIGLASPQSPVIVQQLVTGYGLQMPFLGSLGLSIYPVNLGSYTFSPILTNMDASGAIPSLSYGYTAGAQYRYKGIPGSLVLGGYDQSRSTGGKTFTMPGTSNTSLIIGVQSILLTPNDGNTYSATAQSSSFYATVDTTYPYLWLPESVCDSFETAFNLTYDTWTGFYLISDGAERYNRERNATIHIQMGDSSEVGASSVNIELPYEAFDLTASFPLFENATRYFPIRRAVNGEYILGRVILQEAALFVDFERRIFSIAQAYYSDPMPPSDFVAVERVAPSRRAQSKYLKILLPTLVIIPILILGAWVFYRARRHKATKPTVRTERPELDGMDVCEVDMGKGISCVELPSPSSQWWKEKQDGKPGAVISRSELP